MYDYIVIIQSPVVRLHFNGNCTLDDVRLQRKKETKQSKTYF